MMKRVDSKSDAKKRIEAYYNALLQHNNEVENAHTKKTIEFVVSSMDEDEAVEAEQDIIKKDRDYSEVIASDHKVAFEKRIMAYMTKFAELTAEQKELSAPMQELVDKYKNYDFDSLVTEEINGNTFTYRKDKFPIEQYRQELEQIGEKSKGNQWSASVSGDGRLVIY